MKFFAILALAASAVSATEVPPVQVSSFGASCVDQTSNCRYAFNVNAGQASAATGCDADLPPSHRNGAEYLPNVTNGKCTGVGAKGWTWTATRNGNGGILLSITIVEGGDTPVTWCSVIASSDLPIKSANNARIEYYSGQMDFNAYLGECPGAI